MGFGFLQFVIRHFSSLSLVAEMLNKVLDEGRPVVFLADCLKRTSTDFVVLEGVMAGNHFLPGRIVTISIQLGT